MSITQKGLQLINVRQRKIYPFIDGAFKDFTFQKYGEFSDPPARLVYSKKIGNMQFSVEQLDLTEEFFSMLRVAI